MENEQFFATILAIIAMVLGYNLHSRTLKLEKKNGHEQDQINQLKKKIEELETILNHYKKNCENDFLKKELEEFNKQLAKYQNKNKQIEY